MIGLIGLVMAAASAIIAFFSVGIAVAILGAGLIGLAAMYAGVRLRPVSPIPELSDGANRLLLRYGHFYAMPFGSSSISSVASAFAMASLSVGIIALFKLAWVWLFLCIVAYVLSGMFAKLFNPSVSFVSDDERAAHDEIVTFILANRNSQPPE